MKSISILLFKVNPKDTLHLMFVITLAEAMHGGQGMEDMDLVPATFEEWRNRNQQNIEVWVLMITLMLPALAMLGALEKTNSKQEVT